jgi:methylmalonyl-CoA/ethylmalonyl-CoA epimerase
VTVASKDLTKIVHVVRDVAKTAERFAGLFGIDPAPKVVHTSPPDGSDPKIYTWFRGRKITGRVKLANLRMGPVTVELIEPVDAESPWAQFLRDRGEGIFSLVFTVKDFDAHIERLKDKGMPIYHRGEYGTGRYAYFESTDQLGITLCIQEIDA